MPNCLRQSSFQWKNAELIVPHVQPGDPVPKSTANKSGSGLTQGDRTSAGLGLYAIIVVVAAIAYGVYQWHLKQQASA